jgi:hypothetical protein
VQTVRFTKIVDEIGKPEPYTLWLPPEKDRQFQAAIKAHRVMTVHQENTGSAKDFGEIGFAEDVQGNCLVFPKSLKRFEGRRVVGIRYDLLEKPPAMADAPTKKAPRKPKAAPKARSKPEAKPPAPAPKFEPLRVFQPEEASEQPKPAKPKRAGAREENRQSGDLMREVRKAMKKLEQGNAVAAYQILDKAVSSK